MLFFSFSFVIFFSLPSGDHAYPGREATGNSSSSKPKVINTDLSILDRLLRVYDRRALPTTHLGIPTIVTCSIFIRSFGSINPATMDYETDLYLRQSWIDERLKTPNLSRPLDLNDPKLVQMIWKPEVYFPNAKHAEFQYVTVPNVLVRIYPSGNLLYMLRLKLRFSCMMDLYKYPMDAQVCGIELASFSKTTDELNLRWSEDKSVILYENLKLPQFQIKTVNTSLCKEKFHIGEYSCLKADFYLQRALGYHMVQSYLPTILIVVISWVSFWLDVEAIPARVTLGVTTLLTISSKGSGIQAGLPPVSYVKAIDVWLGACTTFVFTALLEFTLVNYLWRKGTKELEKMSASQWTSVSPKLQRSSISGPLSKETEAEKEFAISTYPASEDGGEVGLRVRHVAATAELRVDHKKNCTSTSTAQEPIKRLCDKRFAAQSIDRFCRVGFPILFLGFNLVYWPYYLIW